MENFDTQVRAFVQEIQNRAPIAYRNRTLFEELKTLHGRSTSKRRLLIV